MTSLIDSTKPVYGNPTTQSVRDNFLHAYDEITDLQSRTALAPFLPTAGGLMNGPITMQSDPLNPMEVATKRYVDDIVFGGSGTVPDAPTDGLFYARGYTTGGNTWSHDPLFSSIHIGPNSATDRFLIGSDATTNFIKFDTTPDYLRFTRSSKVFDLLINNTISQSWSPTTGVMIYPAVTINSALTVNNTITSMSSAPTLNFNSPTIADEYIYFKTNNLNRWAIGAGALDAAGIGIYGYDAAGALLGKWFWIDRVSGDTFTGKNLRVTGNIITTLADNIPTDANNQTVSAPEYVARVGGHYAINAYIGAGAWKRLQAGWAGYFYQDATTGSIYTGIFPSGAANATPATATQYIFGSNKYFSGPYILANEGRVISQSNNPATNPSLTTFSVDGGCAFAIYTNASKVMYFAMADGDGTPRTPVGSFSQLGDFQSTRNVLAGGSTYVTDVLFINPNNSWEWKFRFDGTNHLVEHRAGHYEYWNGSDGTRGWYSTSGQIMVLNAGGNWSCMGNATVGGTIFPIGIIGNINGAPGLSIYKQGANGRFVSFEGGCYDMKNPDNPDLHRINSNGSCYFQTAAGNIQIRNDAQFIITGNGWKPGGGAWADGSDARMKTILGDYTNGLSAIIQLTPRRYKFLANETYDPIAAPRSRRFLEQPIADDMDADDFIPPVYQPRQWESNHIEAADNGTEFIGLVAQETEHAMPEMVTLASGTIDNERVDDIRLMDTTALNMAFINAFKEVHARLVALETNNER